MATSPDDQAVTGATLTFDQLQLLNVTVRNSSTLSEALNAILLELQAPLQVRWMVACDLQGVVWSSGLSERVVREKMQQWRPSTLLESTLLPGEEGTVVCFKVPDPDGVPMGEVLLEVPSLEHGKKALTVLECLALPLLSHMKTLTTDRDPARASRRMPEDSQTFLQHITDTAPTLIYLYDLVQHRTLYSNRYQLEVTGFTPQEMLQMTPQELAYFTHPDELETSKAYFARLMQLEVGQTLTREYRTRHKNGSWRWLSAHTTLFSRAADGSSVVVLGAAQDITDRKQTEQALKESEERFKLVADSAPVMIWLSSLDGGTAFYNKSWLEFRGRTLEQELGTGWMDGVHPEDLPDMLKAFEENARDLQAFELEFRLKRWDGEYRWIVDRGAPRFTSSGTFLGFVGACIDIHDRKTAQDALQQLMEAQKRFVADAAHEIRTPLTSMQGNLDILFRYPDIEEEEKKEILGDVQKEAGRLGRLVNDMLQLARGDSGAAMREDEVELEQVVLGAWKEIYRISKGHQFELLNLENITLKGDTDRLKQLCIILLENAIKYTPRNGAIRLSLTREDSMARLEVSDTGVGISEEDLPRVFERFYRVDQARHRGEDPGGTGLGLPIAKWIVDGHHGTIELLSRLDHGTTAVVRIPIRT